MSEIPSDRRCVAGGAIDDDVTPTFNENLSLHTRCEHPINTAGRGPCEPAARNRKGKQGGVTLMPLPERNSAILPVLTQWAQNAIVILELEVNDRDVRAFTHAQRQAAIANFIANLLHLAEREGFDADQLHARGFATFENERQTPVVSSYVARSVRGKARSSASG